MTAAIVLARGDLDAACGAVFMAEVCAWEEAAAVGAELVAAGILDAAEVADRLHNVALAVGIVEFYGADEVQRAIASAFTEARAAFSDPEMMEAAA
jgi:hypothetical protein